jgi:hypothetical protein
MKERKLKELRQFEVYLTSVVSNAIRGKVCGEDEIPSVICALANCLTGYAFGAFGKELAPQIVSSAINRAIEMVNSVQDDA